jgi:outer membrane protein OmpU
MVSQSGASKNGRRSDDIETDAVLNFKGSTKLDNGLTVGLSVQMRAENQVPSASVSPNLTTATPDTVKRSYAYIKSAFGEVRIGDDDDARRQKAMTAPVAGPLFGANTPDLGMSNGPALTNTTMRKLEGEKRVSRLAYFTPTIAGFSFAVSYAPGGEKGSAGPSFQPNNTPTTGVNVVNNAVSVAGSYSGKFGDFGLDGYAGVSNGHRVYSTLTGNNGSNQSGRDNPTAVSGGAVLTFGPFAFGGAYEWLKDRDTPVTTSTGATGGHQERNTWDVGARYTIGPFGVSTDWTRAILQNRDGNSSGINDIVSLVGDYVLGPGIDVGAAVDFNHYKSNFSGTGTPPSGTGSYTGLALMAGLGISF